MRTDVMRAAACASIVGRVQAVRRAQALAEHLTEARHAHRTYSPSVGYAAPREQQADLLGGERHGDGNPHGVSFTVRYGTADAHVAAQVKYAEGKRNLWLDTTEDVARRLSDYNNGTEWVSGIATAKRNDAPNGQRYAEPLSGADREALRARRAREATALAEGKSVEAIEAERAEWLAKRAKKNGAERSEQLAEALAVASSGWAERE